VKSPDSERVLRVVRVEVGSRDSVGASNSKTAPDRALFPCPVGYGDNGVGDELAVVRNVGAGKRTSLGAVRLVRTRVASFVGSIVLGAGVWVVVWVEKDMMVMGFVFSAAWGLVWGSFS
jgi:hypothetical protein